MKFRLLTACLFLALVLSCSEQKPLEFKERTVSLKGLDLCAQSRCPDVSVFYMEVAKSDPRAAAINSVLQKKLGEMISSAVLPGDSLITQIEPAVKAFVKSFQDFYGDFPEDALTYQLELESQVSFQSETVVSILSAFYAYTGGAHGYGTIDYTNLDAETGALLSLDDLITEPDEFTAFAEAKFKEMMQMGPTEDINSGRFYFDEDGFYLPEIFGFTQDGMEFYFATYEISSYAEGPVSIPFSWEEIEPWLKMPVNAL